jgi:hypothetical protein
MARKKTEEFVEVEGIKCSIKNPSRKATVLFYQNNLREETDKYIANNRMTEKRRAYADVLEINIKVAPFVLGWLKRPEDEDEYRVIKGLMTIEELEAKRKKEGAKNKKTTRKKAAPKKRATRKKS